LTKFYFALNYVYELNKGELEMSLKAKVLSVLAGALVAMGTTNAGASESTNKMGIKQYAEDIRCWSEQGVQDTTKEYLTCIIKTPVVLEHDAQNISELSTPVYWFKSVIYGTPKDTAKSIDTEITQNVDGLGLLMNSTNPKEDIVVDMELSRPALKQGLEVYGGEKELNKLNKRHIQYFTQVQKVLSR
jgi:hypothetical protein